MNALRRFSVCCAVVLMGGALALRPAAAQSPVASIQSHAAETTSTLRLTLDEAVRLALEHNPELAADRLDPQISDMRVAQAVSAYAPSVTTTVQRNGQLSPPTSFLIGAQGTRTDAYTSNVGVSQRLPWAGSIYNVSWDSSRTTTDSFLENFNPRLRSGLNVSFSQPLLRDLTIDGARQQVVSARLNREITGTRFRESTVHTVADVKRAYWDLVATTASVAVQQRSLELAQELARINQARVDVGQAPPLDLLSARAEVAQREEALIVAQASVRLAEDRLRTLVVDPGRPDFWTVRLEPTDPPASGTGLLDVKTATQVALRERADLIRARTEIENARTSARFYTNQRLPDVRLLANYQANGLGGTRLIRTGGFPGTIVGGGEITTFGRVLDQVLNADFPNWTVGFTISYPVGRSFEDAALARARLEETQAKERLKNLEIAAVRQVRQTAWQLETNAKRIQTTRAARELAEQRLDAEQKRFEVGMSTSFLVIQAQRDLAQARNNELSAQLAYDVSLIEFEAIQQAGPSGGSGQSGENASNGASAGAVPQPAPRLTIGTSGTQSPTGVPPE